MTTHFFPIPANEDNRLARLRRLNILDSPPDSTFDGAANVAAQIMEVPIALVSLIDADRQWFKAKVGIETVETPRDLAFCAHAIMSAEPMIVPDASNDPRFSKNPLVTGEPYIRFYAGVPLITRDGYALGTLCAIDREPRTPTSAQIQALVDLSRLLMSEFDLREASLEHDNALERLQLATKANGIGIWEYNKQTSTWSRDQQVLALYDVSPGDESHTSKEILARLHPEDIDHVKNQVTNAFL